MPLLVFTDQKTEKVYTYEVSKYSCERADRDIAYATSLFETLRAEDQEREDAALAKQLDADQAQQHYDPEPGSSTANPMSKDVEHSMSIESTPASQALHRWTREQTLFLIETLPTMLADYERSNKKKHQAYEDVTKLLREKGYNFGVDQVKNKWLLLQRLYKQNLDLKHKSGEGKITWEYFEVMDDKLGKRRENDPVSTFSSTGTETKSKRSADADDQTEENESEEKKDSQKSKKRKSSSSSMLLEYLEAKKVELEEREKNKQKRHEEKMKVKEAGIQILNNILNKL